MSQDFRPTSGKAVASLILGIVCFTGCCFAPIFLIATVGLVLGLLALRETAGPNAKRDGRGLAVAGVILNLFHTFMLLVSVAFLIIFGAAALMNPASFASDQIQGEEGLVTTPAQPADP